MIIRTI